MKSDPEGWLDNYGDALFRYALLKTGNQAVAEDLVQETLIAALKGHKNFRGDSSEKTWLIGILKHKVMDHFRRPAREQPLEQDEALGRYEDQLFDETGHWREPAPKWHNPHQALEDQAFLETLNRCLEELPQRHSELFMLSELEDIDNTSLCKLLDISSTNNLWVMLSRIRARLRRCLDNHWFKPTRSET